MGSLAIAQKKGGSARKDRVISSEEIEKDAIKGDLICLPNCSTYVAIMRVKTSVKTSVYKTGAPLTVVYMSDRCTQSVPKVSHVTHYFIDEPLGTWYVCRVHACRIGFCFPSRRDKVFLFLPE